MAADATGGTITYSGGYTIHTFNSDGNLVVPGSVTAELLVVAGGGGGSRSGAGGSAGGGAGKYIYDTAFDITKQTYAITVGDGGINDENGEDSVFDTYTATGGGAGDFLSGAHIGGSGGGGSENGNGAANDTNGTNAFGNSGGNGNIGGNSGGGGGAGAAGIAAAGTVSGDGGVGKANSITGSSIYYAGGGGGSAYTTDTPGDGGNGGGGRGANGSRSATPGTANTGGGGGGSYQNYSTEAECKGGSGVVIISYLTGSIVANTGNMFLVM